MFVKTPVKLPIVSIHVIMYNVTIQLGYVPKTGLSDMQQQKFGEYITHLRENLGISKSELARRTGMTRAYIGFIEDDHQPSTQGPPNVGEGNLRALARELGVPIQEMFDHGYKTPPGFRLIPISIRAADQVVREVAERYSSNFDALAEEVMRELGEELEDIARVRIMRLIGNSQSQSQSQKQEVPALKKQLQEAGRR